MHHTNEVIYMHVQVIHLGETEINEATPHYFSFQIKNEFLQLTD